MEKANNTNEMGVSRFYGNAAAVHYRCVYKIQLMLFYYRCLEAGTSIYRHTKH